MFRVCRVSHLFSLPKAPRMLQYKDDSIKNTVVPLKHVHLRFEAFFGLKIKGN